MTFDELLQHMVNKDVLEQDEHFEEEVNGLMDEIMSSGESILGRYSDQEIAGLITLVQASTFRELMSKGDLVGAAFCNSIIASDIFIQAFKACVGIIEMEEIR